MSRGDLSPYDLDLGSGRVHTHTQSGGQISPAWSGGAAQRAQVCLLSLFSLPFMTIAMVRLEIHTTELRDIFSRSSRVQTRWRHVLSVCGLTTLRAFWNWFAFCYCMQNGTGQNCSTFTFSVCSFYDDASHSYVSASGLWIMKHTRGLLFFVLNSIFKSFLLPG